MDPYSSTINRYSSFSLLAVKKRSLCSSAQHNPSCVLSSYLVLEIGDGEEEEFEELVEFGEGQVAPPLPQDPLVHVLQYPDAAD